MVSTASPVSGAAGGSVGRPVRRRWLDQATSPGRLRRLLIGLLLLSLAWGVLAAFTAGQYASAAASVVSTREPLSLDAQQIYSRLSDANDTAATAFLTGGLEPAASRQRYLADLAAASAAIQQATARVGAGGGISCFVLQFFSPNSAAISARSSRSVSPLWKPSCTKRTRPSRPIR